MFLYDLYYTLIGRFIRRAYIRIRTAARCRRAWATARLLSDRDYLDFRLQLGEDLLAFDDDERYAKAVRTCRRLGIHTCYCDPQCVQEEIDRLCLPRAYFVATAEGPCYVGGKCSVLMSV